MLTTSQVIKGVRVLVVEDEALIAEEICEHLTGAGCEVVGRVDTGAGAVDAAFAQRPDVILMDIRLKGSLDGIEAADRIGQSVRIPVIYLTAHSDEATLRRAKATNAYGYLLKPFQARTLLLALAGAIERVGMEQRLEDHQLTYATILGSISDGVIVTDRQGCIRFVNPVAERMTGWTAAEAQGEFYGRVLGLAGLEGSAATEGLIAQVLRTRSPVPIGRAAEAISREGVRVPVEGQVNCILDSLGRLVGASITLRDVTEARRAEGELRAAAQQLRAVIDTAVDGVILFSDDGRIRMVNAACERLFGHPGGEFARIRIERLLPSAWSDVRHRLLAPTVTRRGPAVILQGLATTALRRDGSRFPAELSVGHAWQAQDPLYVAVVHDVTERHELQAALLDAVGSEQRRFGNDLHDGLGQELTGLSLLLGALTRSAETTGNVLAPDLRRAGEVARDALQSCRNIAFGLSPIRDASGSLILALKELVSRLNSAPGTSVDFSVEELSKLGLSPTVTEHLYRIAQEALANALKHAGASQINVRLHVEPARVVLEICDDGENPWRPDASGAGLGLRTMQYRASVIGARFEIAPAEPVGTCVICECPQAA
jgi:PAS domain S-box-containing protein